MKFYSPTTNGFYDDVLRADYEAAATWPADATPIDNEHYDALFGAHAQGAVIQAGQNGQPTAVMPPPETVDQIRARAIVAIRAQRAPILDALAGIGFDAMSNNDTATVKSVAATRQGLRDITSLPALVAAQTYDDMHAAVMTRYRELVDAAAPAVQTAFREVFAK